MPVPEHILVSFRGHFGAVTTHRETWSFGLRFPRVEIAGGTLATLAAHMSSTYNVLHSSTAAKISNQCFFDEVRLYEIGTDGRAIAEPTIVSRATPTAGPSTAAMPWQNTVAITLEADGLGRGKRGRFYLPGSGFTIENTGLIPVADAEALRAAVKTFLEGVSNPSGIDVNFGVRIVGRTGEAGTMRIPARVRVGRVVDTQRRRRRQVDEAYVETSLSL